MAHHVSKSPYARLTSRLNRFPQGAPPGETLYKILALLFSEREAELVSVLPLRPFSAKKAASIWKMNIDSAGKVLDELAGRAMLLDMEHNGETVYVLPPPMAGFFEFSMMRINGKPDQKILSELYYQYVTVEDNFMRSLFQGGETQMGRMFVQERAIPEEHVIHVLDYERASEVIRSAGTIGVSACYCRHKMLHLGRACKAPLDICMTFNACASSLTRHGHARSVEKEECLDLLNRAYDYHLAQFGENVREGASFICNCCGCCCEAMIAARRFGFLNPVHTTNYLPAIDAEACTGCGKCAAVCPVEAMTMVSAHNPRDRNRQKSRLDRDACLGCGVCVRACPARCIRLERRPERIITPRNSVHRIVMMAIERGTLSNLLFDNRALLSHRVMGSLLDAVLRLPPVKRILASKQVKSRFLESVLHRLAE